MVRQQKCVKHQIDFPLKELVYRGLMNRESIPSCISQLSQDQRQAQIHEGGVQHVS